MAGYLSKLAATMAGPRSTLFAIPSASFGCITLR